MPPRTKGVPNHYATLGLTPPCDAAQIRKAYRAAAKKWHPDKNRDNIEEATERFKMITEA